MPDKSLSGTCGYEFFAKFMRPKNLLKRVLLMTAFSGFVFFAAFLLFSIPKHSIQNDSTLLVGNIAALSNQEQANTNGEMPARLKIPSINVDASIEYVGLTSAGAMDAPKGPNEVAWFNLGPRPGEEGSAVVAGHMGWKNNIPAVFDNLHKLRIGDKVSVEDENGVNITFVVREIRTYGKDEVAPDVFGSSDGKAHLNLITCAGAWNKTEKTRSERFVVFTDKE